MVVKGGVPESAQVGEVVVRVVAMGGMLAMGVWACVAVGCSESVIGVWRWLFFQNRLLGCGKGLFAR